MIPGGMSDMTIPEEDPPPGWDLRRPLTLEQLIADCGDKIATEAREEPSQMIDIMVGTELMMELALRVIGLEVHTGLLPQEKPPGDAPEGESQPV